MTYDINLTHLHSLVNKLNAKFATKVSMEALKQSKQRGNNVLFEFHLKFCNTASIGIPVRSLLKGRQTSNCRAMWTLKAS